jgi:hypothetical protein
VHIYCFVSFLFKNSILDPCHFGSDPDPDPRIRTGTLTNGSCSYFL